MKKMIGLLFTFIVIIGMSINTASAENLRSCLQSCLDTIDIEQEVDVESEDSVDIQSIIEDDPQSRGECFDHIRILSNASPANPWTAIQIRERIVELMQVCQYMEQSVEECQQELSELRNQITLNPSEFANIQRRINELEAICGEGENPSPTPES